MTKILLLEIKQRESYQTQMYNRPSMNYDMRFTIEEGVQQWWETYWNTTNCAKNIY